MSKTKATAIAAAAGITAATVFTGATAHAAVTAPAQRTAPAATAAAPGLERPAPGRHRAHEAHLRHVRHLEHLGHLAYLAGLRRSRQDAYRGRHRARDVVLQADTVGGSPQETAAGMLGAYGWGSGQMACLVPLWDRESGWRVTAENSASGAYGIPQALPGAKMASAGPDWRTSAGTQIRWGLTYIEGRYGSPCRAWEHSEATGWY